MRVSNVGLRRSRGGLREPSGEPSGALRESIDFADRPC
jgi:hypothetical protein